MTRKKAKAFVKSAVGKGAMAADATASAKATAALAKRKRPRIDSDDELETAKKITHDTEEEEEGGSVEEEGDEQEEEEEEEEEDAEIEGSETDPAPKQKPRRKVSFDVFNFSLTLFDIAHLRIGPWIRRYSGT
jgi:hypothetical protein